MNSKDLGLFIFTIILINLKLIGQTVEPSKGIEKKHLQLEVETVFSQEKEPSSKTTSWQVPNILVRYGLTKNVELQLHTPFTKERCFNNNKLTSNVFKFEEIAIGASVNLWEQNKLLPEAAVMVRIVSPTQDLNKKGIGNILSLNFSNTITEKLCLNYNIANTTDVEKNSICFYVVNVGYEANSRVHFFIEQTSEFTFKKNESNCLGTGFGLNLSHFFTIDFSLAKSLKNNMFHTGAIMTWIISPKKH